MSRRSNVLTFPVVPSQALIDAAGEEVNDLCGVWITRLTEAAVAGASSISVETTTALSATGRVLIDGRPYTFNVTDPATLALTPNLAEDLRALTPVVCLTRILDGVDAAKNQLFVDTAEGEFLDALGRNYNVTRPEGVNDATFRAIIKATAFLPRSTLFALETVLDALVGEGLYTIFEDRVNFPKVVFVDFDEDLEALGGKSFLAAVEETPPSVSPALDTLILADPDLLIYYPLDDASNPGTVVDLAGGYDLTVYDTDGVFTWGQPGPTAEVPLWPTGDFDISDTSYQNYLARAENVGPTFPQGDFTCSMIIKGAPAYGTYLEPFTVYGWSGGAGGAYAGISMSYYPAGATLTVYISSFNHAFTSIPALTTARLITIVLNLAVGTYGTLYLYIDGVLHQSAAITGPGYTPAPPTRKMGIVLYQSCAPAYESPPTLTPYAYALDGSMAHWFLSGRAYDTAEVLTLAAAAGITGVPPVDPNSEIALADDDVLDDAADSVVSVRLAPHTVTMESGSLPSAQGWTWAGSAAEGGLVSVDTDGSILVADASGANDAIYTRPVRALRATGFDLRARLGINSASPSGSTLAQRMAAFIEVCDGTRQILIGFDGTNLYTLNGSTGAAGITVAHDGAVDRDIRIVKRRGIGLIGFDSEDDAQIEIYVNGVLVGSSPYSFFVASALHRIRFGTSASSQSNTSWYGIAADFDDASNLWNLQALLANVDGDDVIVITSATPLVAAMDGRVVVVSGSQVAHARADGLYIIDDVVSTTDARLKGLTHKNGTAEAADRFMISSDNYELFSEKDVGVQSTLTSGAGASAILWTARLGCEDGDLITVALVNPGANNVVIDVSVTTLAIVVNPATNAGGGIISTAEEIVEAVNANTDAAALITASLPGAGTGVVSAFAATNLAGGEDGKVLAISSGVNAGVLTNIATLLSEREVFVGRYGSLEPLTPSSVTADWRKDPNFLGTEIDLDVELVAVGEVVAGPPATLILAQPFTNIDAAVALVEVTYLVHKSAEAMQDVNVVDVAGRHPLYLFDRLAFLRGVLEDILPKGTRLVLGGVSQE